MLLSEMETRFTNEGLVDGGFAISRGKMPMTPDLIIALYETGGTAPDGFFDGDDVDQPGLQVVTRGAARDHDTPRLQLERIYQAVLGWGAFVVDDVRYMSMTPRQAPFPHSKDGNERLLFAVNFLIQKELSPVLQPTPLVAYQLIEDLGGDRNAFKSVAVADAYPTGLTFDTFVPGSWPVLLNSSRLYAGSYYFECSARVSAAGARAKVALFDLTHAPSTVMSGSELTFSTSELVGERLRSAAFTVPDSDSLIVPRLTVNSTSIDAAAWGCRILRA